MNRYKPIGWRNESYRHYLARRGISTKRGDYGKSLRQMLLTESAARARLSGEAGRVSKGGTAEEARVRKLREYVGAGLKGRYEIDLGVAARYEAQLESSKNDYQRLKYELEDLEKGGEEHEERLSEKEKKDISELKKKILKEMKEAKKENEEAVRYLNDNRILYDLDDEVEEE